MSSWACKAAHEIGMFANLRCKRTWARAISLSAIAAALPVVWFVVMRVSVQSDFQVEIKPPFSISSALLILFSVVNIASYKILRMYDSSKFSYDPSAPKPLIHPVYMANIFIVLVFIGVKLLLSILEHMFSFEAVNPATTVAIFLFSVIFGLGILFFFINLACCFI